MSTVSWCRSLLLFSLTIGVAGGAATGAEWAFQPVKAPSTAVQIAGLFSDMHFNRDTGDIGGAEVFIVRSLEHGTAEYFALVQLAFGKPDDPVLTRVTVTKSTEVEFEMPNSKLGTFRGRVTADALVGAFDGNGVALRLRRGKSFYQ